MSAMASRSGLTASTFAVTQASQNAALPIAAPSSWKSPALTRGCGGAAAATAGERPAVKMDKSAIGGEPSGTTISSFFSETWIPWVGPSSRIASMNRPTAAASPAGKPSSLKKKATSSAPGPSSARRRASGKTSMNAPVHAIPAKGSPQCAPASESISSPAMTNLDALP
jgi:hypothetical protein